MPGNSGPLFVLQARDRRLLEALEHLRVIDRDQARMLAPFGSITRANTRLLRLATAGLLARLAVGTVRGGHRYLYARTRAGAAVVGGVFRPLPWNAHSPIVAGQPLLEHQLRLNQLYFALPLSRPTPHRTTATDWRTFARPPFPAVPSLIPDAFVVLQDGVGRARAFLVEIDLATEPLATWLRKTEKYVAVARSGGLRQHFSHDQFGVLVVLPSVRRLHSVRRAVRTRTTKLFWFTTAADVNESITSAPVWFRPDGDTQVSLT